MKKVTKTHTPQKLTEWCNENREVNHKYEHLLGTEAHQDLKSKLLQEQGWLCAYTGRSIDSATSHVEHIKPQNDCAEWEDVEYRNLIACFPAGGGDTSYGYGAPVKAGWWDEQQFVTPLSSECERRFRFVWSGHVHPNPKEHVGAIETIKVLGLDEKSLCQLRRARIDGFFGFGQRTRARPLSIKDAEAALATIESRDNNGRLQEFCFVIKQLLEKYIEKK